MNQKVLAVFLLIPFTLLSLYAVIDVGYIGIFDYHRHSSAGWQVFTDLVVACVLLIVWMINDAKSRGRNPWPFVITTVFLGSFGPLLYILLDNTKYKSS